MMWVAMNYLYFVLCFIFCKFHLLVLEPRPFSFANCTSAAVVQNWFHYLTAPYPLYSLQHRLSLIFFGDIAHFHLLQNLLSRLNKLVQLSSLHPCLLWPCYCFDMEVNWIFNRLIHWMDFSSFKRQHRHKYLFHFTTFLSTSCSES